MKRVFFPLLLSGIAFGADAGANPLCPALKTLAQYFPTLQIFFVGGLAIVVLIVTIVAFVTERYRHGIVVLIAGSVGVLALWSVASAIKPKVEQAASECEGIGGVSAIVKPYVKVNDAVAKVKAQYKVS